MATPEEIAAAQKIIDDANGKTTNTGNDPAKIDDKDKGGKAGNEDQAWLRDRLKKKGETVTAEMLKTLGFATVQEAQQFLEKARKADEATKTEFERAAGERDKAKADLATLQAKNEALERDMKLDRITLAIRTAAASAGAIQVDDIVMKLNADNLVKLELLSEDGKVKADEIAKLITTVKTDRPNWFKRTGVASPSMAGGTVQTVDDKAAEFYRQRNKSTVNF